MNISAVIIAGGESRRLNGINKSRILVDEKTVIERQRAVIQQIIASLYTISDTPLLPDIPNYADEFKKMGPIVGIYTALKHLTSDYIFAFSCDMPFLNSNLILAMIKQIESAPCDALVPKHSKGIEPLHAIYKKTIIPTIEEQFYAGNYQIRAFFNKINMAFFDTDTHGYGNNCFFNINYPEDIIKANEYASRIKS